jgi:tRNA pseudouridine38-40 synthase
MPRYKLIVEYDGTLYAGWQFQDKHRSVQQAIEEAILAFSGETIRIRAAGRTDAGVHASHQVIDLDLTRDWKTDTVRDAINAYLKPEPIAILSAEQVDPAFSARIDAIKRHYRYRILNRRPQPALERNRVWHIVWPLDAKTMHDEAQTLLGKHDFTTFRAAECQASGPLRTLDRLDVERVGDEIHIYASARSFLHHQVRSITGSLMMAGSGRWPKGELKAALEARDRARCGPMAPAAGLSLIGVDYPAK